MAINTQAKKSKDSVRTSNGLVSYESVANRLRLVIPAKRSASGEQERPALRLKDTLENRAKAQRVADIINSRIDTYKDYDPCKLNDYIEEGLGRSHSEKESSNPKKEPQLDELWEEFSEFKKEIVKRPTWIHDYRPIFSNINKLSTKSLSDAKKIHSELRAQTTYARFHKVLTLISACCDRAVRKGRIKENTLHEYCERAKSPNSDTEPLPFSRMEMEQIIAAYRCHPDYNYFADYVDFKFKTGCRPGEGFALKWKNVFLNENYIYFCESLSYDSVECIHVLSEGTKNGKPRKFPIDKVPKLKAMLEKLHLTKPDPEDYVFQDPKDGSHLKYPLFYQSWHGQTQKKTLKSGKVKEYCYWGIVYQLAQLDEEEGGIGFYRSPYNTRHTFITLAIEKWFNSNQFDPRKVVKLADLVGNKPAVIFDHYLGRSDDTSLVNIDVDEPALDASLSQHEKAYSYQELQAHIATLTAKLVAEKQLNEELTQRLEALQHLQSSPIASATVDEVTPKPSPILQRHEPVQAKASRRTQPSALELEQLTLFSALGNLAT